MLLDFKQLVKKYNLKIKGVIQAGAHTGEEIPDFKELGIKRGYLFEPCSPAYDILHLRALENGYTPVNCGLAASEGFKIIHKETANIGQSNSILRPKKHLEYYPDILFEETETIQVQALDAFQIIDCNLLMMDVQGYEMEVLKGAVETIKKIDFVYTEVNSEELYEGCAKIEDLDLFLGDFKRVETRMTNKGWGDSLYIRKTLL